MQQTITMDIKSRKINFIQDFLEIQNEDIITRLEKFLKLEKKRVAKKSQIQPMTIEEFNQRIDESMRDSDNDRLTKADDLLKEIKQ